VLVLALAAAAPALAEDPPPPTPPGTPSIDQYVETVPTSNGGTLPGVGKAHVKPLPHKVATRLQARNDAVEQRLKTIATSSTYGAPQRDLTGPAKRGNANSNGQKRAAPEENSALSAAVTAVSDSGDSHIFWLLAAVIVVTTSMVWAAARRHRA
jgi:hypothetical protein